MKRFLSLLLILVLSVLPALADPLPMLEDYAEDLVVPYDESDPSAGVFSYSYRYPHVDENAEVNENLIATAVMDDFFFVKAKNESRVSVDFRKYALDESLKGFFIRLVEEDDEIDEETKGQIVRMGLRALSGEEIIQ